MPYDFDFCGLVNADYAFTSKDLPGKTVRDRYYLGECRSKEDYNMVFNIFAQQKETVYSLFTECNLLSRETQVDAIKFLSEFYDIIENSRMAKKMIVKKCW